jgi:hypothetical protein
MPTYIDARREAARGFFDFLESQLKTDEVLADKQCVRLIIEKAQAEQAAGSRKRFDAGATFRSRLLYGKIDDAVALWCRRREIRADPYTVFRYEGRERGPTQHETALAPSVPIIRRAFDRLAERVPEIPDCRRAVEKVGTKAIAPALRFQHPLPFGAAGEVTYDAGGADVARGIYLAALYAATGGDPSRGWRYDCGLFVAYSVEPPRAVLGEAACAAWPAVRVRIWDAARVWVILL